MRILKLVVIVLFLALPGLAYADMGGVPGTATWYFHADFDAMRDGKAGRGIYDWLDGEVFSEIRDDLGKEANQLTAYAAPSQGPVIVLDGKISQATKDKVLALAATDGELQTFKASGKAYYLFDGDDDDHDAGKIDIDIDSLEEEAYVSVALKNKIVITNTREQMEELLDSKGRIDPKGNGKDALFVLTAERNLVQAGVNTDEIEADDSWDSNILRNTRKIAVLLADLGDKLGLEAQLMTQEPEMATSMASIVRGLIGLQAFNDEMDPDMAAVLQSTKVDVAGNTLKISLALEPDTVVSALED